MRGNANGRAAHADVDSVGGQLLRYAGYRQPVGAQAEIVWGAQVFGPDLNSQRVQPPKQMPIQLSDGFGNLADAPRLQLPQADDGRRHGGKVRMLAHVEPPRA